MVIKNKKRKIETHIFYIVAHKNKIGKKEASNLNTFRLYLREVEDYIKEITSKIYKLEWKHIKYYVADYETEAKHQRVLLDVVYDDGDVSYPLFTVIEKKVSITI